VSKVVLYSALVVEAPAGPGMWDVACKKPLIGEHDGVNVGAAWATAFQFARLAGVKETEFDPMFLYNHVENMKFFGELPNLRVFWIEPFIPTVEESRLEQTREEVV